MDPRITLRKLEIFELVAELESVSRAADRLWLAQPVVSTHIRSLEEKLGVTLFERRARRMELTEAGPVVHLWAADVLRLPAEASRSLAGLLDGSIGGIAFGASISIGCYELPPVLADFRRDRPEVTLNLEIDDYWKVLDGVKSSVLDFGVVCSPRDPASPPLLSEPIGSDKMVAVAMPGVGTDGRAMSKEEFSALPFIEVAGNASMNRELDRAGIRPQEISLGFDHPEAVKTAVSCGLGVSVLFRSSVAGPLREGSLREIEIEGVDMALGVYLVHSVDKVPAPAQLELMKQIRELFASPSAIA